MTEEILERIKKCVAEVLAITPASIAPQSRLIDDLGADSLDLVELMYLMEQEFSLRLSRNDLSLSAQLGIAEEAVHVDEVLTPKALELLRRRFPKDANILVDGITRNQLAALLTVEEIARVIGEKIDKGAQNQEGS